MTRFSESRFMEKFDRLFPAIPVKYNIRWRDITTLGTGGEIPLLVEPTDDLSLLELLKFCRKESINNFIIGGGSNVVGPDEFFDGIVIRLSQNDFVKLRMGRQHVTAGAGVRLYDFVAGCARKGFGGIASLAGIPGTIGGALRMNAGAGGVCIGDVISELCGFDKDGNPWSTDGDQIEWGYRCSSIPENVIITAAIFLMPQVDQESELEKINETMRARRQNEPKGRSAGCAFKNVSDREPAGKLLDDAGCKGICCGDAVISGVHANYIINHGGATEKEITELMLEARSKVLRYSGFYLNPEYCFVNHQNRELIEHTPEPLKIVVLMGGNSSEREVSLESGKAVATALRRAGYKVDEVDIRQPEITETMRQADLVFPVLHGGFGENGEIQQLMEQADISFVGCGSEASSIVFDKLKSKRLMDEHGILTPPWGIVTPDRRELPAGLEFPVIVKPPREGSTVGIVMVENAEQWDNALDAAFKYDGNELLVEKYIAGKEATVGIVNGEPMPMVEIQIPGKMYDYDAKYIHAQGHTRYLCPPETITEEQQSIAQGAAMKYFYAADARDLLRVDFIMTPDGEFYMLEGNNLPGFTSSSLVPKASAAAGMSFERLCAKLVQRAAARHKG